MTTSLCCSPLNYSFVLTTPREIQAHEALIEKLTRIARAAFRMVNAMAHQFASQSPDTLRLAEFIAREHSTGRLNR